MSRSIDDLVSELQATAARLRSGDLGEEEAAQVVESLAELAATIASELERAGRDAEREGPAEGQEQLL